jgi:hypothetical protein
VKRPRIVRGVAAIMLAFALAACGSATDLAADPNVGDPVPDPLVIATPFTLTPDAPTVGEAVTFDASEMNCPAAPCTFVWEDVNGGPWLLGEGETLTFTFSGAGVKKVQLTVTDAEGRDASFLADVRVLASGSAQVPEFVEVPRPETPGASPITPPGAKPDPMPTPAPPSDALTWAPPAGYRNFQVVDVPIRGGIGSLRNDTDYLLIMPSTPRRQPLTIDGGRHVVIIGGEIDIEDARTGPESAFRGIMVRGGSVDGRIVHIEGLKIHSSGGTISDGINTSAGDSRFVLQVQNVRIGPLPRAYVNGSKNHHPDVIQTWGSVGEIRIDGLTGISAYQGLFFKADFNGRHGDIDIRRTNLRGLTGGAYLFWLSDKGGGWPTVSLGDVWVEPAPGRALGKAVWPDSGGGSLAPRIDGDRATWSNVPVSGAIRAGSPSGGDFVPEGSVGIGYVSPGYR